MAPRFANLRSNVYDVPKYWHPPTRTPHTSYLEKLAKLPKLSQMYGTKVVVCAEQRKFGLGACIIGTVLGRANKGWKDYGIAPDDSTTLVAFPRRGMLRVAKSALRIAE